MFKRMDFIRLPDGRTATVLEYFEFDQTADVVAQYGGGAVENVDANTLRRAKILARNGARYVPPVVASC
jgi:hypothetical protein